MKLTKNAAGDAALAQGNDRFTAHCKACGTETAHYSRNRECVPCTAVKNARRNLSGYNRRYYATRKAQDREFAACRKALGVNSTALQRIRDMEWLEDAPPRATPTPETLRECAEFVKHAPADCELDHGVPLKGFHPVTGEWVVSGLHVPYNLEPMTKRSNVRKSHYFDPMAPLEFQKPRNPYPGGQFHGEIGKIEFMRYTQPTTLELMTVKEWRQAIVDAGNEDMAEWAAQWDDRQQL